MNYAQAHMFPAANQAIRILLLEDYAMDAELVSTQLRRSRPSWTVEHVNNKQEFINALQKSAPDVVVSDYSLPQFSGIEALKTMRELGFDLPFILLTGHLSEEVAKNYMEFGVDDYVLKTSLTRLDHSIDRTLQRRRAESEKSSIAQRLSESEHRYRAIFEHAGVAMVELTFPGDLRHIPELLKDKSERLAVLKSMLANLEVSAVNKATLRLFEVNSVEAFSRNFQSLFNATGLRHILRCAASLPLFGDMEEELLEARTIKGHSRTLLVKTVFDPSRPNRITASFTDMTEVKESEHRAMRIVERLEDTVAQRVEELSELNRKLQIEAREREKINAVLRDNYIQMTDSIIAAKRIQQLLLPSISALSRPFSDTFVYMRPKGIVSGDFYWHHEDQEAHWIACVDCTGHGVPGAFMSMLSAKLLNQAVVENNAVNPACALQSIDEFVIRELKQHDVNTRVSTGMDISLCRYDSKTKVLQFASAYQFLIIKHGDELELIRGDRRSLGGTFKHHTQAFTLHERQLEEGDCLYLFTDGYVDQFGGPKNKKYTRRRLMDLIAEQGDNSMYAQELAIKSRLQDWKGANEQVDDILVMGIRI